jgi:hypothetical protein
MVEVYPQLFVGTKQDYEENVQFATGWRVVHACRNYHRDERGYKRGAPKYHPEYLTARRGERLLLNLLESDESSYVPKAIIDESLAFIDDGMKRRRRVLVHCNQGHSRGPSIALLYLGTHTELFGGLDFVDAEDRFRELYSPYAPKPGIRGYVMATWPSDRDGSALRPAGDDDDGILP